MKSECDWEYISDTGGMSEVPGGTFDSSYWECSECGATSVNEPDDCMDEDRNDEH